MATVPISQRDSDIIQRANYPNVVHAALIGRDGALRMEDNWGQPEWKQWWERFHKFGGTLHAGEEWPKEPPVVVPDPTIEDDVEQLQTQIDALQNTLIQKEVVSQAEIDSETVKPGAAPAPSVVKTAVIAAAAAAPAAALVVRLLGGG